MSLSGPWLWTAIFSAAVSVGAVATVLWVHARLGQRSRKLYSQLKEAERGLAQMTALRDVGLAVSSTLELSDTLRILLEHIQRMPHVVGSAVMLTDSVPGRKTLAQARGLETLLAQPGGRPALDYLMDQVLESGSATSLSGLASREGPVSLKPLAEAGINTFHGFPLIAQSEIVGVLSVYLSATNGLDRWFHTFMTALSGEAAVAIHNARLFTQMANQVRELQATRDRLVQSEKLSLIGELVSGVAHELNNPLTAILGYAQMLEEDVPDAATKAQLHNITEAALRSRSIVHGLLSVARKHEPRREWIDVNGPLQEVLQLKAYGLRVDNIAVETHLGPDLPKVLADPHQLHQMFLNLVNNAHQAMEQANGRGRLLISSCPGRDSTVRVEICDDGPGIPAGVQEHIFEPFFTTKSDGTGLGLSIAQGIVNQHGGTISISSQGQGCCVCVELPVAPPSATAEVATDEPGVAAGPPRNVLVVEDEAAVADFIRSALERAGHTVTLAFNGEEALARIASDCPDLIIADVKMPAMRGDQFLTELQVLHPELVSRVIFVTGDIANHQTVSFLEESRQPRLVKPFGADDLRRAVSKLAR